MINILTKQKNNIEFSGTKIWLGIYLSYSILCMEQSWSVGWYYLNLSGSFKVQFSLLQITELCVNIQNRVKY